MSTAKPPASKPEGLPIMSDIALMGNLQMPDIETYPDYRDIVVVDRNNKLKIAPKPDGSSNVPGFSFSGLLTQQPEMFNKFIPPDTRIGMYLMDVCLHSRFVESARCYGAARHIKQFVHVEELRGRIVHIPGDIVTTYHSGAYYRLREDTIEESGSIPENEIMLEPGIVNQQHAIYMRQSIRELERVDFTAHIVLSLIPKR